MGQKWCFIVDLLTWYSYEGDAWKSDKTEKKEVHLKVEMPEAGGVNHSRL